MEDVDIQAWVSSRCFRILGRRVGLRSTSAQFATQAARFLRSFPECLATASEPEMLLSVDVARPNGPSARHSICRDGQTAWTTERYWQLFRQMEWQLLSFLSEHVADRYLIHGGAVAHAGHGTLLPGASESGKTTLTLALVLRGYDYSSDELVVLDPVTGRLEPFAKPISCKNPSLFPSLAGSAGHWLGPELNVSEGVWYLHPADLRPDAIARPVPIRQIVFPRYDPAASPKLEPLAPGETMRRLLENSVNFDRFGAAGLKLLAGLAKTAKGYSLVANHPDTAAELVTRLDR